MPAPEDPLLSRQRLTLDPRKTAVLLIDLQEEPRLDPRYPVAGFEAVLRNARQLADAARARGIEVLHACILRRADGSDSPLLETRGPGGAPDFGIAGTPQAAFCPETAPLAGEKVFEKTDASCFSNPALEAHLASCGLEWLVVAGVWTDACVFVSVKDAALRGRRVLLVKDACGSGTTFMHQVSVLNLANRLHGGGVADTARALALLEGATQAVWTCPGGVPFRYDAATVPMLYDQL